MGLRKQLLKLLKVDRDSLLHNLLMADRDYWGIYNSLQIIRVLIAFYTLLNPDFFFKGVFLVFLIDFVDGYYVRTDLRYRIVDWSADFLSFLFLFLVMIKYYPLISGYIPYWILNYFLIFFLIVNLKLWDFVVLKAPVGYLYSIPIGEFFGLHPLLVIGGTSAGSVILEYLIHLWGLDRWRIFKNDWLQAFWLIVASVIQLSIAKFIFL